MPLPTAAATIPAQAFRNMGMDPIGSFADTTPEAAAAAEVYPTALKMVLEVAEWSFATRVVQLGEATPTDDYTVDDDFPYAYVLPADLVALREVLALNADWRIDMGFLRTNVGSPLKIRYTAWIEREDQLPAHVQNAIALQMAVLLAPRYVQARTKQADLITMASNALDDALRYDGRNASPKSMSGAAWVGNWDEVALQ